MGNGLYLRKARAHDGKIVAEYLSDDGIWKRVPFGSEVAADPDRFNRQMARDGKKSLIMTCILAVGIIGPLVWLAFHLLYERVVTFRANAPYLAKAAEDELTTWTVLIGFGVVMTVICVAIMFESNNRYWGIK